MSRIILIDSGPLGYVTNPQASPVNDLCSQWLDILLANGEKLVIPEIADYEARRGWLRAGRPQAVARLDRLKATLEYVPITAAAMLLAAELWADARRRGYATAGDQSLDADVILAAQAITLGENTVIATTNVGHLGRYTQAEIWDQIR